MALAWLADGLTSRRVRPSCSGRSCARWEDRARGLQQVGDDVIDASDFLANIFHYGARGTGRREVAANDQ